MDRSQSRPSRITDAGSGEISLMFVPGGAFFIAAIILSSNLSQSSSLFGHCCETSGVSRCTKAIAWYLIASLSAGAYTDAFTDEDHASSLNLTFKKVRIV